DSAYKQALQTYLKRKSKKITEVEEGKPKLSFTREKKSVYIQPSAEFAFAMERWQALARQASAVFEKHPDVFDSSVTVDARRVERLFVNSEGSRLATWRTIYSLSIFGVTRASDGQLIRHTRTVYSRREGKMPSVQEVTAMAEQLARDLEALKKAPKIDPYTGPAILDGEATGVLFHEVIGHRLEGERQLDEREGKTFKGHLGKRIIPTFLSVLDDPTLRNVGDVELNGFYRYDDEGVPAQRVMLIDHGILKSYLLSRTPVENFTHSNGHGRAAAGMRPRARMANTIVKSEKRVPFAKLKEMLIEEVNKQGKPYGLIIKSIIGGSTHTYNWGYQAYKGVPEMVYRVFPDGREELVRGVEIVGTPIASINKIVATSDKLSVFNGYCGAESGYVPVSAVAPDVLMTEIELQRSMKQSEKPPILPSPWNATAK
ncbi:MAG: TldD/PmbA family protein, partial [Deltaproteobacteria bacterium]